MLFSFIDVVNLHFSSLSFFFFSFRSLDGELLSRQDRSGWCESFVSRAHCQALDVNTQQLRFWVAGCIDNAAGAAICAGDL